MATALADSQLLEAIEAGDIAAVEASIRAGANCNAARKSVSLRWRIMVARRLLGKDQWDDKLDTVPGESAMCLAIKVGDPAIVRLLLAHGCDPNASLEWKVADGEDARTMEAWERRWRYIYTSSSLLEYALGSVSCKDMSGNIVEALTRDAERGYVLHNRKGASVSLDNPVRPRDAHVRCKMNPSEDIVDVLLEAGASVTPACLSAATRLKNRKLDPKDQFLRILECAAPEDPAAARLSRTNSDNSSPSLRQLAGASSTAQASVIEEQRRLIEEMRAELYVLRKEVDALRSGHTELHHRLSVFGDASLPRSLYRPAHDPDAEAANFVTTVVTQFDPTQLDEITLMVGNRVHVRARYTDGWGHGLNMDTGIIGFFPLSCLSDRPQSSVDADLPLSFMPPPPRPRSSATSYPPRSANLGPAPDSFRIPLEDASSAISGASQMSVDGAEVGAQAPRLPVPIMGGKLNEGPGELNGEGRAQQVPDDLTGSQLSYAETIVVGTLGKPTLGKRTSIVGTGDVFGA